MTSFSPTGRKSQSRAAELQQRCDETSKPRLSIKCNYPEVLNLGGDLFLFILNAASEKLFEGEIGQSVGKVSVLCHLSPIFHAGRCFNNNVLCLLFRPCCLWQWGGGVKADLIVLQPKISPHRSDSAALKKKKNPEEQSESESWKR